MAGATDDLGSGLLPGEDGGVDDRLEDVLLLVAEETHVDKGPDEFRESLVTEGTSDDGLGLVEVIPLCVRGRVAIGVGDKGVAGVNEVWLGGTHKVGASNVDNLAVLDNLCGVSQGEKDTAAAPRELVTEWVTAVLWRWETTTVAEEACDLAAGLMDLVNGLDSVQVIDTRIKSNLVHDSNASLLGCTIQLHHGGRNV